MIGREAEIKLLRKAAESEVSEFVAVYGRRRVGKTFLVNEVFNSRYAFHHAGMENATRTQQLQSFRETLKQCGHRECPRLTDWITAFAELENYLAKLPEGRKIVFLDELPWYDTPRSGFLPAFEQFWNLWASSRKDILLVICGSATTWIIDKVINSRGGLHNRVTRQLPIVPFTLKECEEYADYKHLTMDRRQLTECYMALGGVAYYWSLLQEGMSAAQNLDRLFFGSAGELRGEYDRLFASLFRSPADHLSIVETLGARKMGLTRNDIVSALGKESSGDVTRALNELCNCGFIRRYNILGNRKKDALYQLMDNYILFYFAFLKDQKNTDPHFWTLQYDTPRLNTWRGLAFERVCLAHVPQMRAALGITGVLTEAYAWRSPEVQIDLLLDRRDGIINLCEMKYSSGEYELKEPAVLKLENCRNAFIAATKTKKAVSEVMVTPYGLKPNSYSGAIQNQITLKDLFK